MPAKKILLATRPLVPPWDEASKNFAYFLAKEVHLANTDIHILTTPVTLSGLDSHVISHPLYTEPDDSGKAHYPFWQKARLPLYLFMRSHTYDIIHYLFTPTLFNTFVIRYLAPFRPKTIQTIATLREDRYSKRLLRQLFFADQLITYTEATKKKLLALGLNNVTRIYPGIDLERFSPQPKNQGLLTELGLKPEHFVVLYPGEYVRLGATDMLTETFLTYFQKHPETNLRFVFACRVKHEADHKKKQAVHRRFAEAGLLNYISFSDTITDMPGLYNTADVIIFPAENLRGKFDVPLVIIEAYACGKPVILSDLPEFEEFTNSDICVTIPKDSGTSLIESVAYLKQNEQVMLRLGDNARRFVKDHFDLKNTAKQYEEIYQAL
ncbi:MAG: glycosyltransferase family 4 protein [Candidatus Moranbacteria bacterium]|nr:glycosyltransferase family 4 protein [Candidatus Moranbacteria bacterium]